ncbi:MAG: cupin domain-containing protein [Actinomycetota bacterium]|nr:cupin domain-containing protein [Actinomycetota bacterium]
MSDPNFNRPEWDVELADPPFRARVMRLGPRLGASELGVTLYELDPGGAVSPYHAHHGNEELLLVVAGHPHLRTPGGERALEPGAVVGFPRGPEGAHAVTNPSGEPARVLIFSTMRFPDVAEHVDTGTVLAVTGPRQGWAFPADADVPVMQAVVQAMQAPARREDEAAG